MADVEKMHNASSQDPEKINELAPNTTLDDGDVDDVMFKHANADDGDEALKAFAGHDGEIIVMTPEMEKKIVEED